MQAFFTEKTLKEGGISTKSKSQFHLVKGVAPYGRGHRARVKAGPGHGAKGELDCGTAVDLTAWENDQIYAGVGVVSIPLSYGYT